jgi:hypothetical protein
MKTILAAAAFLAPLLLPAETSDVGDFGSSEPVPRADLPTRGHIVIPGKDWTFANQTHWHEYTGKADLRRWGAYDVRITYNSRVPVRIQFRSGEERLRVPLKESPESRSSHMGTIRFTEAGPHTFSLYTPQVPDPDQFVIEEIRLIPAYEGEKSLQAQDGGLVLEARTAATWSENLRYEPKPEKNCLGYWTDAKDWAEWEMDITRPGKFLVTVFQGCGTKGGSRMQIQSDDSVLTFDVKPTGGFQKWQGVEAGEIEFKTTGLHRLSLKVLEQKNGPVMDVQKIVLQPKP